jgi:hypothetical protein
LGPPLTRQTLLRGAAGFALSLGLWWAATPGYDGFLAAVAEPILRLLESPPATRLSTEDRRIIVDRSDFPADSPRPALPADNLTFNVVLLGTLAATTRGVFSDRGIKRLAVASGILVAGHVASLVCAVKSIYALQLGEWSTAHYGPVARNLWATAAHFDRFVGSLALAFLLWWMLVRPAGEAKGEPGGRGASSGRSDSSRGSRPASRRRGRG